MFHSLYRIFKFASQDFWRNIWLSIITISVLVLTLISVNSLIIFRLIANESLKSVQNKIDVSVYFKPEVTAGEVNNVKSRLDNLKEVKSVKYVSSEDALSSFKEKHKDDPEILSSLDEVEGNPIGASLIIKAKKLADYPRILRELDNEEFKDLIQDKNFDSNKLVISRLNDMSNRVEKIVMSIIGIFIFIAIVIVFNTIKIAIYTHRQEIEIKKLVGATNWFIKAPYLLEAIFYSILAILVLVAFIYPVLGGIDPYINNFFEDPSFSILSYFNNNFLSIFGWQLLAIIVLNIISSSLAVGRYVKV